MKKTESKLLNQTLSKSPTGIKGFDEITNGGLPTGRPTLVCGGPGCGKTLFGMEFPYTWQQLSFNQTGCIYMSFEETNEEINQNVASLAVLTLVDLVKIIKNCT